jgi:hypothetical protein
VNDPATVTASDSKNSFPSYENVVFVIVTHGVWIETLLRVYQAPDNLLYDVIPHPAGANASMPPVTVPKRVHNGDAYYCECISTSTSHHRLQLQRIQKFHQICGPRAMPLP